LKEQTTYLLTFLLKGSNHVKRIMHIPFPLTVGALIAMRVAIVPVSAALYLRKSMNVRQRRKTQTLQTVAASECDADLAIVSFEYCFYSCGLDEAECEDLIEGSSPSTSSTVTTITNATSHANSTKATNCTTTVNSTLVANCTTNVTAVAAEDSGENGDPMACESNPSGFELVAAFLTVADATAYCTENCGLDEKECTRWKQRYILAEMQRRLR
jgi:hypothetical protein